MAETNWMRNREGMGLWEHRGKVAVVGWGQAHIDQRWDGGRLHRSYVIRASSGSAGTSTRRTPTDWRGWSRSTAAPPISAGATGRIRPNRPPSRRCSTVSSDASGPGPKANSRTPAVVT